MLTKKSKKIYINFVTLPLFFYPISSKYFKKTITYRITILVFYIRILTLHNFTLIKADMTQPSNLNENGYTVKKLYNSHSQSLACVKMRARSTYDEYITFKVKREI